MNTLLEFHWLEKELIRRDLRDVRLALSFDLRHDDWMVQCSRGELYRVDRIPLMDRTLSLDDFWKKNIEPMIIGVTEGAT